MFFGSQILSKRLLNVSVATPAEPRGEEKLLCFVQIFGGENF